MKKVKPVDVDNSGKALKSQYESQLLINGTLTAAITMSCYHTTNNVLVQLKGKRTENNWDKKIEAVKYFVRVTMKSVILLVENNENYETIKKSIREPLNKM